jgi:demethylmenaquinone methyltransferase/2-methoxy-6-polyprenyl-1,4-benzoquinol methylase
MRCDQRYYRVEPDGHLTALNKNTNAEGERCRTTAPLDAKSATPQQKEDWVHGTFQRISGQYDLMNDLESFGLHRAWKRVLVRSAAALKPKPQAVLDIATGTGDIALALAKTLPEARVVGFDFSENMLDVARRRAARLSTAPTRATRVPAPAHTTATQVVRTVTAQAAPGLSFLQGNALEIPFDDDSFDVVTIAFGLRNLADYRRGIEEMTRVLRPGGSLLCLEASYPTAPLVRPAFRLYFRYVMPAMGALITRKTAEYRWLNDSTEAFLSKQELAELMARCGLVNVRYRSFALGAAALHQGVKPAI